MRCKDQFRFLLFTVLMVMSVWFVASCAQREVKQEAPAVEQPSAEAPAPATAETAQAPEASAPTEPEVATPAASESAPPPAAAAAAPAAGATPEQFKNIDPSLLIYLSSRGVLAGTGDPTKVAGDAEKIGQLQHPAAMELAKLPKDQYGLVDWAVAIKNGLVKPLDSLEPGTPPAPPFNLDVVIHTKSNFMPDVVFPHYTHTLWLTCTNCHVQIFQMKAGGNPEMTMPKIAAGEYCGRCHNRVAFPLTDCARCHVKAKETAASPAQTK